MNDLNRPLRLWFGLTVAFVAISALLVSAFSIGRMIDFERANRDVYRRLIQSYFTQEYSRIAEETYLKLPTLALHEQRLNELMDERGHLSLVMGANAKGRGVPTGSALIAWHKDSRAADQETGRVVVAFGDVVLGDLTIVVDWTPTLTTARGREVVTQLCGLIVAMVILSIAISAALNKSVIGPLWAQLIDLQKTKAVANTVQMIAHDVRKPFTKLRAGLALLGCAESAERLRSVVAQMREETESSIDAVEGMLADVMEVGAERKLYREYCDVSALLHNALRDILKIRRPSSLSWDLPPEPGLETLVDRRRLMRVLQNIIDNAVQATPEGGRIWGTVRAVEDEAFLELVIGNSGSYVPPESLEKLFDAFYSQGKKDGTGLGLAIARQIIEAHGGRITCRSDRERGTEFVLTLPASHRPTLAAANVPCVGSTKPVVALLEDDPFLAEAWQAILGNDVELHWFDRPKDLRKKIAEDPTFLPSLALLVLDQNFENEPEAKGTDVASELAALGSSAPIVLASDEHFDLADFPGIVAFIDKQPDDWSALRKWARA